MKTNELTGAAIDWAVAKCEGYDVEILKAPALLQVYVKQKMGAPYRFKPSTDWEQGGPIIEREKIGLDPFGKTWIAHPSYMPIQPNVSGPTPLIAAMRCYVASKLGEEVEIPQELSC